MVHIHQLRNGTRKVLSQLQKVNDAFEVLHGNFILKLVSDVLSVTVLVRIIEMTLSDFDWPQDRDKILFSRAVFGGPFAGF